MKLLVLTVLALLVFSGAALAYAPPEPPSAVKADPEAAKKLEKQPKSKFVCKITGRLHCSEYGTRYKDPLLVVFDCGYLKFSAPVSEGDGAFEAALPLGEAYAIKVQFQDKSAEIGKLECPLADSDTAKAVDIYQPGSELELVWGLRDGGKVDVDVKVKD